MSSTEETETRTPPAEAKLAPEPGSPTPDSSATVGGRKPGPLASPLLAPVRGALAGFVGTGAMTLAQYAYQRAAGSASSSTPAEGADVVLRKLGLGLSRRQRRSSMVTNLVHFGYGTGWGIVHSLIAARRPFTGVGFGAGVWSAGLGVLPALGVSKAPWKQDPRGLATELAFHLVYGSAVSATDRALQGDAADPAAAVAPLGLGIANGMRTMTPPAAVALRRAGTPDPLRWALVLAAIAELGLDKHPAAPSRSGLQGMPGRALAGSGVGWFANGHEGALIGGSSAVASGLAMETLRGRLGERFEVPDAALGVVEDAIAVALSLLFSGRLAH